MDRNRFEILGAGVWYWVALILAGLAAAGDVIARVAA